jgi:cytidine deaminase
MNTDYKSLIKKSLKAIDNSYAPYSKFKVGAAILTAGNKIFSGSNIECASYSLTICAERVAAAKAISEGEINFKVLAISTNKNKIVYPCGACLQFLTEFSPDLKIILVKTEKEFEVHNLKDFLPKNFILKNFILKEIRNE